MVMPKTLLLVILCLTISLAGAGLWIMLQPAPSSPAPATTDAAPQTLNHDLFGASKRYDMENGQQMRPRW